MAITRRSYTFTVQRPQMYTSRWDWSSGSPVEIRTPAPAVSYTVEATGDDVESARQMAASQYGAPPENVSPVIGDDGQPKCREYEESVTDSRSLRRRALDGEDGFGR